MPATVAADLIGGCEYNKEMVVQIIAVNGLESARADQVRHFHMDQAIGSGSVLRLEDGEQMVYDLLILQTLETARATCCQ
jgi:hypothetical protein